MSWDVMIYDIGGNLPSSIEQFDESTARDLGTTESVRSTISEALPETDWSDQAWGIYDGDDYFFEFNIGNDDMVDSFMVHVRGGGDAISGLIKVIALKNWTILDCSTGEFIDPKKPNQKGWQDFQEFQNRVTATISTQRKRPWWKFW
jgi:hypothetical protein